MIKEITYKQAIELFSSKVLNDIIVQMSGKANATRPDNKTEGDCYFFGSMDLKDITTGQVWCVAMEISMKYGNFMGKTVFACQVEHIMISDKVMPQQFMDRYLELSSQGKASGDTVLGTYED